MEESEVVFEESEDEEEFVEDEPVVEDDDDGTDKSPRRCAEEESFRTVSFLEHFAQPPADIDTTKDLELFVIDIECQKRRLPDGRYDSQDIAQDRLMRAYNNDVPSFSIHARKRRFEDTPTVPCIRIYGKTRAGSSVCLNLYGYYPVVHLLTSCVLVPGIVAEIREKVEAMLSEHDANSAFPKRRPDDWQAIISAKTVKGFPASPYTEKPYDFIEFTLADPAHIRAFGAIMRKAGGIETSSAGFVRTLPYSCEDVVDKFQADRGISGCGWIRVCGGQYRQTTYERKFGNGDFAFCQVEFDARFTYVSAFADDSIAPLRMITYDIECASTKGFPDAENPNNPIIVIAAVCTEYTNAEPVRSRKVVFQYGSADPLSNFNADIGEQHLCFPSEAEVVEAFGQLVRDFDPDFLGGYNMVGFDLPYVVTRANKLNCVNALYQGRRGTWKWQKPRIVIKKRKNGETRETKLTMTPGRIQLDALPWIQGDVTIKLRSYRLGAVAQLYIGDTKDDVGYSMIVPMWKQSDATRSRLAKYCLKDTVLTQGLIDLDNKKKSFKMIMNAVEKSRQTRVPAGKLLRSGVQVRVWSLLLEKAKHPGFDNRGTEVFLPDEEIRQRDKDDKFRGAEVLEPFRGFYSKKDCKIGCGDFRSLYPSVIVLFNIDYGTEIPQVLQTKYAHVPYKQTPIGTRLVDKSVRVGLLPQIEIELMALRDVAKAKMAEAAKAGNMGLKSMYNSRQNEIKVNCNSMYGILNASGGRLTRPQLAESVTSQGREMILQAKRIAEELAPTNHVIYGDTDSIFVNFEGCKDKTEAFKILTTICDAVTASFPKPVMLQPEKVMENVILTNKKRYLSALSSSVAAEPYLDVKGIEVARRDNCQMVVKTMKALLDKLIIEDKQEEALAIISNTLRELLGGRVDISDLVITKAITKEDYKGTPAHVAVAERMKKRDPSYECASGERIPYVITVNGGSKLFEKADDPLWVINHGIQIDYDYYIQNQLAGPCSRILMWVIGSEDDQESIRLAENYLRKVQADKAGDIVVSAARKQLGKSIELMQKHTQTKLFGPSALSVHVRKIQSTANQKGKIDSFFSRVAPAPVLSVPKCSKCSRATALDEQGVCSCCASHICYVCHTPVPDFGPCAVCAVPIEMKRRAVAACTVSQTEDIEALATEAKAKCDKCRGYTDEVEIKCVQRDCNNLYRRATLAARLKKK